MHTFFVIVNDNLTKDAIVQGVLAGKQDLHLYESFTEAAKVMMGMDQALNPRVNAVEVSWT